MIDLREKILYIREWYAIEPLPVIAFSRSPPPGWMGVCRRLRACLTGVEAALTVISSKGLKVWPDAEGDLIHTDYLRCRVETRSGPLPAAYPVELLRRVAENGFDVLKFTYLFEFDGVKGFTLSAGE